MVEARFDPNDFQKVAEDLTKGSSSEAQIRTAISRVYYSLFLVALYHFFSNGRIRRKLVKRYGGTHAVVIAEVKRVNTALGGQLDVLRELRIQADYRLLPDTSYSDWSKNWYTTQLLDNQIRKGYQRYQIA